MVSARPAPRHAVGVGETEAPQGRRGPHGSLTSCHPDQPEEQTEHAFVNVLAQGDLSSIRWVCSPLRHAPAPGPGSHLCTIYYASLNFRDIMLATGKLSPDAIPGKWANRDCMLGMEFSGRDASGKRVMGLVPAKGLATSVMVSQDFVWDVPSSWTLEEAASVPVVYTTAYYSLVVRGRMQRGETVLIHSGSGGVGQAAIAIALSLGCRVFTTVGEPTSPSRGPGLPGWPCSLAHRPGPPSYQARPKSRRTSRPGSPSSMTPASPTRGTRPSSSTC